MTYQFLQKEKKILPCCHGMQVIDPKAGIPCLLLDINLWGRDGYLKQCDRTVPGTLYNIDQSQKTHNPENQSKLEANNVADMKCGKTCMSESCCTQAKGTVDEQPLCGNAAANFYLIFMIFI